MQRGQVLLQPAKSKDGAQHGKGCDHSGEEIAHDYRTLMKYLPADQWLGWRHLSAAALARLLRTIAGHVNLKALTRSQRGPKKPPRKKPVYNKKHKHYSTARLLQDLEEQDTC